MGPALFAYRPWIDESGTPAPPGTHLTETVLLLYESSMNTGYIERSLDGYQHPDEWEGGAWITTDSGEAAVLFAGTKGTGAKYWYGYVNPAGPEYPCVEGEMVGQFALCRLADGTPCPPEDLVECEGHNDYRGWWSSRFDAQIILYDPADLAQVTVGEMASWEPQPYATLDIDDRLLFNPPEWEQDMLGTEVQRRYRVGAVAYDRDNGLLYVLELFADGAKPAVHVWGVGRQAQQPLTASRSASSPWTLRKVSCWPAKEAEGRSSAVAEERTATLIVNCEWSNECIQLATMESNVTERLYQPWSPQGHGPGTPGAGFVDEDGDGVCDNIGSGRMGRQGGRWGR